MNVCVFCGPTEATLTEEHIWPQCVSRLVAGRYGSDHFINVRSDESSTKALRKSSIIDTTSTTVCEPCNSRWLSTLENVSVLPIASGLINSDEAVLLSPQAQSILAAWAYKIALLMEVADKAPQVPFSTPEERLQFRQSTLAHPYVKVFITRYEFGHHPGFGIDWRHTKIERATGITHLLKVSTFTVGYLGMQVLAVKSPDTNALVPADEVGFNFEGKARDAILQIWPVNQNAMQWPPIESLSGHELDDWASIFKDPNQPEE